jgi:uncharacterized membrane protein
MKTEKYALISWIVSVLYIFCHIVAITGALVAALAAYNAYANNKADAPSTSSLSVKNLPSADFTI